MVGGDDKPWPTDYREQLKRNFAAGQALQLDPFISETTREHYKEFTEEVAAELKELKRRNWEL